jgi:sterol O-acyltransferase
MKTYSFVRENAIKVIRPWKEKDSEGPAVWYQGQMNPRVGSFGQYLYFLFCPTLLYRDNYPRTAKVNLQRAGQYLFEFVGLLLVSIMASKNFIRPAFEQLPNDPPRNLIMSLLGLMCLGLFHLFTAQGAILHAWMNFHAELTRFADRHFYEDWWTCTDYQTFYRKWNYVVYDWIHAYIYKDVKKAAKSRGFKKLPVLLSMIISSLFHEYIIAVALKYLIPFLSIEFVLLGGIFYFLRPVVFGRRIWNTIFLFALSLGNALMVWLYAIEFYARVYCPKEDTLKNAVIPRIYECFFK